MDAAYKAAMASRKANVGMPEDGREWYALTRENGRDEKAKNAVAV